MRSPDIALEMMRDDDRRSCSGLWDCGYCVFYFRCFSGGRGAYQDLR